MLCCLYTQSLTLLAHEATNSSSAAGERCSSKARFASFTCKLGCGRKPLRIATNAIILPYFPLRCFACAVVG
jgi:hypothetical protein